METQTDTTKKTQSIVSVKLDGSTKEQIEKSAKDKGVSTSDYLRSIIGGVSGDTNKKAATAGNLKENETSECNLSDESISAITEAVNEVVSENVRKLSVLSPDREYLRKLVGKEPSADQTLSVEEESYLQRLNEAITADVTENLLHEHNSVPISQGDAIQQRMFKQMIAKRNEVVSEKIPTLTSVFQYAISEAFKEDCEALYSRGLFRTTYGIEYSEFKAVYFSK